MMTPQSILLAVGLSLGLALTGTALAVDANQSSSSSSGQGEDPSSLDENILLIIEEITVSARKRDETLHDVPISINVMEGASIAKNSILRLDELTQYVPNVHVGESAFANALFIRGIGSGINIGFEQTVGTFVDGIYFGRGQLASSPFFDLQRVEVLKGPQSIYFGKNTTAGAFNIITADPTVETEASFSTLYEPNHGEKKVEGYFSGTLSPTMAGRFSYRISAIDGWLQNGDPDKDNEPSREQIGLRLGLTYTGIDNLTLVTKVSKTEFKTNGRHNQLGICSDDMLAYLIANNKTDDCSRDDVTWAGGDFIEASGDGPGYDFDKEDSNTNTTTLSVNLNYTVNDILITSLTGYSTYKYSEYIDADSSPLSVILYSISEDYRQLSEELRISSTNNDASNWMLGLYIQRASLDTADDAHVNLNTVSIVGTHLSTFDQDSLSWSFFSDWNYKFENDFSLNIGARYTREKKDARKNSINSELGGNTSTTETNLNVGLPTNDVQGERTEGEITPMVVLKYSPSIDTHYYGSVSTGFKGGGFDYALISDNDSEFEYDEEKVLSYEMGAKFLLLDNRANLNIAFFYSTFKNIQSSTYSGGTALVVSNAGEILTQGIEINSTIKLTSYFDIGFSYGYLNSKYVNFDDAACYVGQTTEEGCNVIGTLRTRSLSGERTQFSPENSINLYLATSHHVFNNTFTTKLDVNYIDEFVITGDLDPRLDQPALTIVNLRLSYAAKNYELALLGKNLTNTHSTFWSSDIPFSRGSYTLFSERFRSIALQYSYDF